MTPRELIGEARLILQRDTPGMPGTWPRAAAFLGRQAIEQALGEFWLAKAVPLADANFRVQWTCLPEWLNDKALVYDTSYAWVALSGACHHHHYELAPTVAELDHWLDLAEAWCLRVEALTAAAPTAAKPA